MSCSAATRASSTPKGPAPTIGTAHEYCMGLRGSGASISSCDKFGMDPVPCLCAGPATPTAAFAADLVELEGTAERYRAAVQAEIVPYFLVIGLIGLIPTYVVGITRLIACARRRGDAADQRTAVSAADRTKQQLQRAGEAAAVLRVRVSFTLLQLGLLLFFYGFAPTITMFIILGGAEVAWGPFVLWLNLFPPGTMLMLLAIRPTNEVSIRVVSAVAFASVLAHRRGHGPLAHPELRLDVPSATRSPPSLRRPPREADALHVLLPEWRHRAAAARGAPPAVARDAVVRLLPRRRLARLAHPLRRSRRAEYALRAHLLHQLLRRRRRPHARGSRARTSLSRQHWREEHEGAGGGVHRGAHRRRRGGQGARRGRESASARCR